MDLKNNEVDTWQELNETKKYKKINESIIIVAPKNYEEIIIPLFCPLCNFPMKTREDAESFRVFSTCAFCSTHWGSKVLQPENFNFDSDEWNDYVKKKLLSVKPIINIM